MWPPSSPELNPCDYYFWGELECRVNATYHHNCESLMASVTGNMASLKTTVVTCACSRFHSRLEALIRVKGNHFE